MLNAKTTTRTKPSKRTHLISTTRRLTSTTSTSTTRTSKRRGVQPKALSSNLQRKLELDSTTQNTSPNTNTTSTINQSSQLKQSGPFDVKPSATLHALHTQQDSTTIPQPGVIPISLPRYDPYMEKTKPHQLQHGFNPELSKVQLYDKTYKNSQKSFNTTNLVDLTNNPTSVTGQALLNRSWGIQNILSFLKTQKVSNMVVFDSSAQSQLADFTIFCTVASTKPMQALTTKLVALGRMNKAIGYEGFESGDDPDGLWNIATLGHVAVHVCTPAGRTSPIFQRAERRLLLQAKLVPLAEWDTLVDPWVRQERERNKAHEADLLLDWDDNKQTGNIHKQEKLYGQPAPPGYYVRANESSIHANYEQTDIEDDYNYLDLNEEHMNKIQVMKDLGYSDQDVQLDPEIIGKAIMGNVEIIHPEDLQNKDPNPKGKIVQAARQKQKNTLAQAYEDKLKQRELDEQQQRDDDEEYEQQQQLNNNNNDVDDDDDDSIEDVDDHDSFLADALNNLQELENDIDNDINNDGDDDDDEELPEHIQEIAKGKKPKKAATTDESESTTTKSTKAKATAKTTTKSTTPKTAKAAATTSKTTKSATSTTSKSTKEAPTTKKPTTRTKKATFSSQSHFSPLFSYSSPTSSTTVSTISTSSTLIPTTVPTISKRNYHSTVFKSQSRSPFQHQQSQQSLSTSTSTSTLSTNTKQQLQHQQRRSITSDADYSDFSPQFSTTNRRNIHTSNKQQNNINDLTIGAFTSFDLGSNLNDTSEHSSFSTYEQPLVSTSSTNNSYLKGFGKNKQQQHDFLNSTRPKMPQLGDIDDPSPVLGLDLMLLGADDESRNLIQNNDDTTTSNKFQQFFSPPQQHINSLHHQIHGFNPSDELGLSNHTSSSIHSDFDDVRAVPRRTRTRSTTLGDTTELENPTTRNILQPHYHQQNRPYYLVNNTNNNSHDNNHLFGANASGTEWFEDLDDITNENHDYAKCHFTTYDPLDHLDSLHSSPSPTSHNASHIINQALQQNNRSHMNNMNDDQLEDSGSDDPLSAQIQQLALAAQQQHAANIHAFLQHQSQTPTIFNQFNMTTPHNLQQSIQNTQRQFGLPFNHNTVNYTGNADEDVVDDDDDDDDGFGFEDDLHNNHLSLGNQRGNHHLQTDYDHTLGCALADHADQSYGGLEIEEGDEVELQQLSRLLTTHRNRAIQQQKNVQQNEQFHTGWSEDDEYVDDDNDDDVDHTTTKV